MNGPVPIAALVPLASGDTGEYGSYGDMHGGLTTYWKDVHAPRPPVERVRQITAVEPIEVVRARIAENQRISAKLAGRPDPTTAEQSLAPPEIRDLQRRLAEQKAKRKDNKGPVGWSPS